jgi:Skp family chaperone for outer membrane proteins
MKMSAWIRRADIFIFQIRSEEKREMRFSRFLGVCAVAMMSLTAAGSVSHADERGYGKRYEASKEMRDEMKAERDAMRAKHKAERDEMQEEMREKREEWQTEMEDERAEHHEEMMEKREEAREEAAERAEEHREKMEERREAAQERAEEARERRQNHRARKSGGSEE